MGGGDSCTIHAHVQQRRLEREDVGGWVVGAFLGRRLGRQLLGERGERGEHLRRARAIVHKVARLRGVRREG